MTAVIIARRRDFGETESLDLTQGKQGKEPDYAHFIFEAHIASLCFIPSWEI
jgi:hypothetical protein